MPRPTPFTRGARAERRQTLETLRKIASLTRSAAHLAKRYGPKEKVPGFERDLRVLGLLAESIRQRALPVEKRGSR